MVVIKTLLDSFLLLQQLFRHCFFKLLTSTYVLLQNLFFSSNRNKQLRLLFGSIHPKSYELDGFFTHFIRQSSIFLFLIYFLLFQTVTSNQYAYFIYDIVISYLIFRFFMFYNRKNKFFKNKKSVNSGMIVLPIYGFLYCFIE